MIRTGAPERIVIEGWTARLRSTARWLNVSTALMRSAAKHVTPQLLNFRQVANDHITQIVP